MTIWENRGNKLEMLSSSLNNFSYVFICDYNSFEMKLQWQLNVFFFFFKQLLVCWDLEYFQI